MLCTAFSQTYS